MGEVTAGGSALGRLTHYGGERRSSEYNPEVPSITLFFSISMASTQETVLIWRLDDGKDDDKGQFECTACSWKRGCSARAARKHAIKTHGRKGTVMRKNTPEYKTTEKVRFANRQKQRRYQSRLKVGASH